MFDIQWSRKTKITINGKEYVRWEDVPEEFRASLDRQQKRAWKVSAFVKWDDGNQPLSAYPGVPVALPDGFEFDDDGLGRRVSWRWFSWYAMRGLIFAGIFSVPLAFVLYAYINSPDKSWPAPALAITALLTLPAAATMYVWLAYLINRTTVRVDRARISVRHGPLPWLGGKDITTTDIDTVVSERVINDSSDSSDGSIFQPREIYRVRLVLKNGKTRTLVNGLRTPEQAIFIEQQILGH